jgi:hypothetical protein
MSRNYGDGYCARDLSLKMCFDDLNLQITRRGSVLLKNWNRWSMRFRFRTTRTIDSSVSLAVHHFAADFTRAD